MAGPLISICIPAYKQTDYLERLLNSIKEQTFTDYEVIVTDDSPDDSVQGLCERYRDTFTLHYFKNNPALGSPENWNAGIRKANGQWIKMMHDDDWFSGKESLKQFADAVVANPQSTFFFSGFNEVDLKKGSKHPFVIDDVYLKMLQKTPLTLFKKNFIGHPSTTLIKKSEDAFYNKKLKWVVDIEFYIRYLNKYKQVTAIKEPLVNIGINEYQITKEAFRNPVIEIPETLYFYHLLPQGSFKNIFVYDYYWRFLRNLSIRSEGDIKRYAPDVVIPPIIKSMIQVQARYPLSLLKKGVVSKSLMLYSYLTNYHKL